MSLGAGETTVLRMTAAYAMFANGGRRITPTLIDRIQDRYGRPSTGTTSAICRRLRGRQMGRPGGAADLIDNASRCSTR
jgi:membrane carboxypeptidase/penicillin-binding protein